MKTTIALLSLLATTAFAQTGFVEQNTICSTDAKLNTRCANIGKDVKHTTQSSHIYKFKENGNIVYSDTAPQNKVSEKLDLNSEKMKNKVTYYHAEKIVQDNSKMYQQTKQNDKQYLRDSLYNARTALYNLKPTTEDDWTYYGRTRIISPAYVEKELFLKKEIVKLELMLEQY